MYRIVRILFGKLNQLSSPYCLFRCQIYLTFSKKKLLRITRILRKGRYYYVSHNGSSTGINQIEFLWNPLELSSSRIYSVIMLWSLELNQVNNEIVEKFKTWLINNEKKSRHSRWKGGSSWEWLMTESCNFHRMQSMMQGIRICYILKKSLGWHRPF